MTNTNAINAHNDALNALLNGLTTETTPTPEIPRFTLQEAFPLIKQNHNLYTLSEAVDLINKARDAWEEIKDDETSLALLNYNQYQSLDGTEDFLDIDVFEFIEACQNITRAKKLGALTIPKEVLDELVDDYDLREYFVDNAREFWDDLEYVTKNDIRERYVEEEMDLSDIADVFDLNQY